MGEKYKYMVPPRHHACTRNNIIPENSRTDVSKRKYKKKSKVSDYEHYKIKTPDRIPSVPEGRETNREEDLPQLFRSEELAEKYIDNYGYPPGDFPQWGPFIDNP